MVHEHRDEGCHGHENAGHIHTEHLLKRVLEQNESLLHHITSTERKVTTLMSQISDFLTAQEAYNAGIAAAITKVETGVTGITGDIATLNQMILDLQNSPDRVTAEDQARIDAIVAFSGPLATRADAVGTAVEALDALTPPAVPPVTPEGTNANVSTKAAPAAAFHTTEQNNAERERRRRVDTASAGRPMTDEERQKRADWDAVPVRNA